jgi:hypothetical protein
MFLSAAMANMTEFAKNASPSGASETHKGVESASSFISESKTKKTRAEAILETFPSIPKGVSSTGVPPLSDARQRATNSTAESALSKASLGAEAALATFSSQDFASSSDLCLWCDARETQGQTLRDVMPSRATLSMEKERPSVQLPSVRRFEAASPDIDTRLERSLPSSTPEVCASNIIIAVNL